MRHVVFRVGSECYGLPLATVREVVNPSATSRVPRAPEAVRGIMNLRGRVVTVVDVGLLFGVAPAETPATGKIIILDRGRRDLGLLVRAVDGIHGLEELAPAPGDAQPSVRGMAHHAGSAVTVLDADGLDKQISALFRPAAGPGR